MWTDPNCQSTRPADTPARIVFVQYGNYAEAAERFANGESESYYAQQYSVNFAAELLDSAASVAVVCLNSDPYDKLLPNGVRALGLRVWESGGMQNLFHALKRIQPTHAIVVTPMTRLLRWATRQGMRTLPLFADSFPSRGIRSRMRHRWLAHTLNGQSYEWVANHNVNSARDLARIGVSRAKIIPWDWPSQISPDAFAPKTPPMSAPFKAIYVGHLSEAKGLADCIAAVGLLNGTPWETNLTVLAGKPPPEKFVALVKDCGVLERVRFVAERVPHREVVALMHQHDAVLIPSRHEYPEGLPMTIYDALCARTPLIASDHPMFEKKILHEEDGLVFQAGNPASLANAIRRLRDDRGLYVALSRNAKRAWEALQCPVKWADIIQRWLSDTPEDRAWLREHTLASGIYD